jgi:ParB-like chromosome segregation protein Spo0J
MNTRHIPIKDIKPNPDNPRIIKDDKFHKLVESVRKFPEMLELRPIVVNSDMVVLGGICASKRAKRRG